MSPHRIFALTALLPLLLICGLALGFIPILLLLSNAFDSPCNTTHDLVTKYGSGYKVYRDTQMCDDKIDPADAAFIVFAPDGKAYLLFVERPLNGQTWVGWRDEGHLEVRSGSPGNLTRKLDWMAGIQLIYVLPR